MEDEKVFMFIFWYCVKKSNSNQRSLQAVSFILKDIEAQVNVSEMNGSQFVKSVVSVLQKEILEKNMDFSMNTAQKESDGSRSFSTQFLGLKEKIWSSILRL